MSDIFRIHVFPAQRGDALWIEYGPAEKPCRILVDGGITSTGREHLKGLIATLQGEKRIDLLIVTHIDLDHIQGVIALLKELPQEVRIDRVWFNGWDQLPRPELQPHGVAEGITLSKQLEQRFKDAWNTDAHGGWIGLGANGSLQKIDLPGGMVATVLSPDRDRLLRLRDKWDDVVEDFGAQEDAENEATVESDGDIDGLEIMGAEDVDVKELAETKFKEDATVPNGSSIACLLEFKGKSALLLADAHPSVVLRSLKLHSPSAPLSTDCVKVAHHGSKANTHLELAAYIQSPTWIFSSNGATTKHPNPEAVARVLYARRDRKTLVFNYRTGYNDIWDDDTLRANHQYKTVYGDGKTAVVVNLIE